MSARPRSAWVRWVLLLVCAGAVAWIVGRLGPRRVLQVVADADPWWLLLSLVPLAGRFALWGWKWRGMLRRRGPVSYGFALENVLAGAFVNLTTPTAKLAGGVVRAALVHRRTGWPLPASFGWAVADQATNVLGHLALAAVLATAAAAGLPAGPASRVFLAAGLACAGLAAAGLALRGGALRWSRRPRVVAWAARLTPRRFRGPGGDGAPAADWLEPLLTPLLQRSAGPRETAADLGLSAATLGALCLANVIVLRALGVDAPLVAVAAAAALGSFAGTMLGTMGGIGATELALIELYRMIGVPAAAATAGALLHRAGFYAVVIGLGGIALWRTTRGRPAAGARTGA